MFHFTCTVLKLVFAAGVIYQIHVCVMSLKFAYQS